MMKILFFTNNFPPKGGGIARFGSNICDELCRRGHEIDVLSIAEKKKQDLTLNRPYSLFECITFSRLASLPAIAKTLSLAKRKHDIYIMGSLITTSALGLFILSLIKRIPYVVMVNGSDLNYLRSEYVLDRILSRLFLKKARIILANSNWMRQRVVSEGFQANKVKVLNPGVNVSFFTKTELKNKIDLDKHKIKNEKIILTVSRLVEIKGHKYVIEALSKLVKDMPEIHYLIIGEGPEKDTLVKLAADLGVSDHVTFIGNICADDVNLPYFYSISKIFVMPSISIGSLQEGFGMVYLEASACGIPVIGSSNGGISDAIVDGVTGFLVKEKDVVGLSEKIKLLLEDDVLRVRMGNAGRERAVKYFSWKSVGDNLENYLGNLKAEEAA